MYHMLTPRSYIHFFNSFLAGTLCLKGGPREFLRMLLGVHFQLIN